MRISQAWVLRVGTVNEMEAFNSCPVIIAWIVHKLITLCFIWNGPTYFVAVRLFKAKIVDSMVRRVASTRYVTVEMESDSKV
jgi:hypothetical protein